MNRRTFLSLSAGAAVGLGASVLPGCSGSSKPAAAPPADRPTTTGRSPETTPAPAVLGPPNADGLRLLPGFTSRVVATTGMAVTGTDVVWHTDPDGGACYPVDDGGWIYVSNSESEPGGASSVRFTADGTILSAARILDGTRRNCAGGATPWGTWLSCEEVPDGAVWECDPLGESEAVRLPALGVFRHEAACVDPASRAVYLTEDDPEGGFYRFTPARWGDLSDGVLDVMVSLDGDSVAWAAVPSPLAADTPARAQVAGMRTFAGGEGTCLLGDAVVFTTKGDDRVWRYDPGTVSVTVLYDAALVAEPVLTGVDNCIALDGDVYVCEDGGDLQIVRLRADGSAQAVVQVTGADGSECTGVAFTPDGSRMYFSSQRSPGVTYEVAGPW